ncbi:unnamed protein product [Meloidogyne enterolobii]|uniref:Uncharacterized protein n=1 Tax=Meloidogyne enterolobii TaxID=390850 RepID=A0ACB0ZXW7_MELEN
MTRYRRTGSIHPRSSQLFSTPTTNTSNKKEIFKYSIPSAFKKIPSKEEISINNCCFNKEIDNSKQEEKQLIIKQQKHYLIEKLIE